MAAFKADNGTWYVSYRIRDLQGKRIQKVKRGFATKREALEFEREALLQNDSSLEMNFASFVEIYIIVPPSDMNQGFMA